MERRRQRAAPAPSPTTSDVDKENVVQLKSGPRVGSSEEVGSAYPGAVDSEGDIVFLCKKAAVQKKTKILHVEAGPVRASSLPPSTGAAVREEPCAVQRSRVDDADLLSQYSNPERPHSTLCDDQPAAPTPVAAQDSPDTDL